MEDIAPALLEALQNAFLRNLAEDQKGAALLETIRSGNGTYATAGDYAEQIGAALAKAFREHLGSDVLPDGKMYWNIADCVVRPLLEDAYRQTSAAAYQVQKALNEAAGLGLKALAAPMNNDRVEGILDAITDADRYDDVSFYLAEPVLANFTRSIVDDAVLVNVEFQGRAGLQPKIIRRAERKCCAWCANLAGEYDYPDVPRDVYRRHKNCRCVVEYDPADGKRRRQNVHTKKWTDGEQYDKLEARKKVGIHSLVFDLAQHPKKLASFTPGKLRLALEAEGFEVKPLMMGSLKGIRFEDGGGFKVNFEDGGLLQYHPAEGSHHEGPYYKISTGKGGTKRYELDGTEKRDK